MRKTPTKEETIIPKFIIQFQSFFKRCGFIALTFKNHKLNKKLAKNVKMFVKELSIQSVND